MRNLMFLAAIILSGCAIEPTPITGTNGLQSYKFDCNADTKVCYQKAGKLCTRGYDIIDHANTSTIMMPHYGEHPMTINVESLTIQCQE